MLLPSSLIQALLGRAPELRDVQIVHMLTLGNADYTLPEYEGHFRHSGLFLGPNVRPAVAAGRADYTPIYLSEIENLFSSGEMPLDVALIQTSPPDEHGYLSLGTSIDCTLTAAECARRIIAEVNDQMPRTMGDTFLHVSKVSAIVETSHPLLELPSAPVERGAAPHRPQRGPADSRWRYAAARHRRHSQCRTGSPLRPQRPGNSQRVVPGRHRAAH